MTDNEFRERLTRVEARQEHQDTQLGKILDQVNLLVAAHFERIGSEKAAQRTHIEDREDKWQTWTWIRSILPFGLITGAWVWLIEFLRQMIAGEGQ